MIPHKSFLEDLALMDPCLSVRWVPWWEGLDQGEAVTVWPIMGSPFAANPHSMPQAGRFVVYEENRITGREERVFDVVYSNGEYMPLDRRTFIGLNLRRYWSEMGAKRLADLRKETAEREHAANKKEMREGLERDGRMHEALERLYEGEAGLHSYALGAPGAPAAAINRRRTGVEWEKTAKAPPKTIEPPVKEIRIAYE